MSNGWTPPMTEGEILEAEFEQSLADFDDWIAGQHPDYSDPLPPIPISPPPLLGSNTGEPAYTIDEYGNIV